MLKRDKMGRFVAAKKAPAKKSNSKKTTARSRRG
jgi:hypothetical protein